MGIRSFNVRGNIGKVRYAVSFHDGEKIHSDKSPFFDLRPFSRKRDMQRFVKELKAAGYVEA